MKKEEECKSRYFELSRQQIIELVKLVRFKKKDIFYDLGCGTGKVVIGVARYSTVSKAIGIEHSKCIYCKARRLLNSQIKSGKIRNLNRVDLWLGSIDNE